jgi:hypothetical protein
MSDFAVQDLDAIIGAIARGALEERTLAGLSASDRGSLERLASAHFAKGRFGHSAVAYRMLAECEPARPLWWLRAAFAEVCRERADRARTALVCYLDGLGAPRMRLEGTLRELQRRANPHFRRPPITRRAHSTLLLSGATTIIDRPRRG